jgi:hypothetical protein
MTEIEDIEHLTKCVSNEANLANASVLAPMDAVDCLDIIVKVTWL